VWNCDLILRAMAKKILDDATSEIYYAQLVEDECTRTLMVGVA